MAIAVGVEGFGASSPRRRLRLDVVAPQRGRWQTAAVVAVVVLHPGAMGTAVGAALLDAGHRVFWVGAGRSDATRSRAEAGGLDEVSSLEALAADAEVVLSICPPHAAADVAGAVVGVGFTGLYVDANAIAPDHVRELATVVDAAGGQFVDGGIIGPPSRTAGATSLYLSGPRAGEVGDLFADTIIDAHVVDERIGSASATKMTFAAWTKGTNALVLALAGVAEREGVTGALRTAWARWLPDLEGRLEAASAAAARKGWRWTGEMREIARTFAAAGEPAGFGDAAADVFERFDRPANE